MKFNQAMFVSMLLPGLLVAASARAESDKRAKQVYLLCTYCHGDKGEGKQNLGAPAIAGLPEWYVKRQLEKFHSGVRGTHPKDIAGMRMTPMARTLYPKDGDFDLVSKYVAALPRPEVPDTIKGKAVKGEKLYQTCIACHGDKAQGNETVGAPPLAGGSDWYFVKQLHNFKDRVRAGDPVKDPTGAAMTGIAAMLSPEDMEAVVSYINVLKTQPK
jgi:cytochrome c553